MRSTGMKWLLVLAVLVVGVLMGRYLTPSMPGPDESPVLDESSKVRGDRRSDDRPRAPSNQTRLSARTPVRSVEPWASVPMPEPYTSLLSMEDDLLRRLAQGDVRAGCRLARELRRCHVHRLVAGIKDDAVGQAAAEIDTPEVGRSRRFTAEETLRHERDDRVCRGVGTESFERYFDVVLASARLGDTRSMIDFAESFGSLGYEFVRHPERLHIWREEAESMIRRAMENGDVTAIYPLAEALRNNHTPLGELIADDPVEALAMLLLMDRLGSSVGTVSAANVLPADDQLVLAASERADEFQRRYFGHIDPSSKVEFLHRGFWDLDVSACDRLGANETRP